MLKDEDITLITIFILIIIFIIFRYFQLKRRKGNLPIIEVVKIIIVNKPNKYFKNNDSCSICLEKMILNEEKDIVSMDCEHTFHKECIIEWLKIKHMCPVCRN